MPRPPRLVVPGCWHHIVQRGNERRQVFFSDSDRLLYLDLVARYASQYGTHLVGFCLLSNHAHWIAVPERPDSLARTFGLAHGEYSRYRNRLRRVTGHLWQARFYSCVCDEWYGINALAYVERNPVRAGLTEKAEGYAWSSARLHTGLGDWPRWLDPNWARAGHNPERWKRVLSIGTHSEELEDRIRQATRDSRIAGSSEFLETIELATGKVLRRRPPGRPRSVVMARSA